jgi:hypothetical protein
MSVSRRIRCFKQLPKLNIELKFFVRDVDISLFWAILMIDGNFLRTIRKKTGPKAGF